MSSTLKITCTCLDHLSGQLLPCGIMCTHTTACLYYHMTARLNACISTKNNSLLIGANSGDLRLVQNGFTSTSYTRGRLEVYYSGQWGTVCDDFWSSINTRVACRQLGFSSSTSWTTSSAGG